MRASLSTVTTSALIQRSISDKRRSLVSLKASKARMKSSNAMLRSAADVDFTSSPSLFSMTAEILSWTEID